MRRVLKYQLPTWGSVAIYGRDLKFLSVGVHDNQFVAWAESSDGIDSVPTQLVVINTGDPVPDGEFLGSAAFDAHGQAYVAHVYVQRPQ